MGITFPINSSDGASDEIIDGIDYQCDDTTLTLRKGKHYNGFQFSEDEVRYQRIGLDDGEE